MKFTHAYMWLQYNANRDHHHDRAVLKFHRFTNEPHFPSPGQLDFYQPFTLRLFYA